MTQATWRYTVYGLRILSNEPVMGLDPEPDDGAPIDLELGFERMTDVPRRPQQAVALLTSPGVRADGTPFFEVWRDAASAHARIGLQHAGPDGRVLFQCDAAGRRLGVLLDDGITMNDVVTYLLGPVLGCVLRLRGAICLHAGVVAVDGGAVAVMGGKGAGKSTTIAALAYQGYPVLSDDIAVLVPHGEGFLVQPGYPQLRLLPDALDRLPQRPAGELRRILSFADKRFVPLSRQPEAQRWRFQATPLLLASLAVLGERHDGDVARATAMRRPQGVMALLANGYPDYPVLVDDPARRFREAGDIAARVAVQQLCQPDRAERLSSVGIGLATA